MWQYLAENMQMYGEEDFTLKEYFLILTAISTVKLDCQVKSELRFFGEVFMWFIIILQMLDVNAILFWKKVLCSCFN